MWPRIFVIIFLIYRYEMGIIGSWWTQCKLQMLETILLFKRLISDLFTYYTWRLLYIATYSSMVRKLQFYLLSKLCSKHCKFCHNTCKLTPNERSQIKMCFILIEFSLLYCNIKLFKLDLRGHLLILHIFCLIVRIFLPTCTDWFDLLQNTIVQLIQRTLFYLQPPIAIFAILAIFIAGGTI